MKIKTKICAFALALVLGCGALVACNQGKKSSGGASDSGTQSTSEKQETKYLVNVPSSNDYTIAGISQEGYLKGAKVSFTVTLTNTDKEITAVGYDTTTLTALQSGGYEFDMPEKNVTLFVNTKVIERYTLSHTGAIQVDGDPITFTLLLGTDPVADDFTLEAVEGAEHVSIEGATVTGVSEGQVVIVAKINGVEKARETITVEKSAYTTIADAIDDAWEKVTDFNDNSKSTKTTNKYKIRAKVVFMGSVYNNKVEMLIDDGTGILDYQIKASADITAFDVDDVIEIEEPLQNYYGLLEMYSSDVKYAKKVEGVTINTTPFQTLADGAAYDAVYNANMVNTGIHNVKPVILQAKAKTVGEGSDAKKRYEVLGATKGLLATTKSVIDLAFLDGATYTFKGYLLNWNDSAKYCNFVAIEQKKLAATSVSIDQENFEIAINTTKQLTYTTEPAGAGQSVAWTVEPAGVVTVVDGLVSAVATGTATIKLTVDGNEDTVVATVVQPIPAESAQFTPNTKEITTADSLDLNELLSSLPAGNSDDKNKQWSVEPADAGTLTNGVYKPAKTGSAVVTVKYNATVSASITITARQQKLADLASTKLGDAVDVYGIVTGKYPVSGRNGLWIADGTSAAYLNYAPKTGMDNGAIIHAVGTVDVYNGARQIKATTYEVVESYEGLVTPSELTITEELCTTINPTAQSRQATVSGIVSYNAVNGSGHRNVTVKVGANEFKIYVHKDNCGSTVITDFARAEVGKQATIKGYVTVNKYNEKDPTKAVASDFQLINPTLTDVQDVPATGLKLNETTANVKQGATLQLTASADPEGSTLPSAVTWTVEDNEKVTVSETGLVSVAADAVAESTATVKATCGEFEASCVITVKDTASADAVVADFSTKAAGHSAYYDTWTYGDFTVAGGANNNKNWAFVKMGGKSATISAEGHPGTYIKTNKAVSYSVTSVTIKFVGKCYNQDNEKASVKIESYSDAALATKVAETASQEVPAITTDNGVETLTFTFTAPQAANMYYKVNFAITNTTTYNGVVALETITFNAA